MFQKITVVQRKRIELVLIAILIIGVIGYAGAGLVYAGARVATADRTLNSVVSHQNKLNATFADINSQLGALTSNPTFKPQDAVALVDRSVANSEVASKTITEDDASLSTALKGLDDHGWLTFVGRSNLDREATRIGHARKALAAARTIAADKALEGHFWHGLYSGLADLATLNGQSTAGDLAAARSTLGTMKADVDLAAKQAGAPPLPADLNALMIDLQAFVNDFILLGQPWGFRLADVNVPVRWWHGDSDPFVPLDQARRAAALLPDVELTVRPGESHLGDFAAADEVLATLAQVWMDRS